jgi:hypothetical protein
MERPFTKAEGSAAYFKSGFCEMHDGSALNQALLPGTGARERGEIRPLDFILAVAGRRARRA